MENPSKDVYIVEFSLLDDHSKANEFPGDLNVKVKFILHVEELTLDIEYEAQLVDGVATPINMTNH